MKRLLLLLSLCYYITSYCQHDTHSGFKKIRPALINNDSVVLKLKQLQDSAVKATEAAQRKEAEERNNRNLEKLVQEQKEKNAREKKMTLARIGIGVAFLVVLIVGLMRRRKKK